MARTSDTHRPRSLRAEQKELTRRKLVAAAKKVFGSKGYAGTSIDDIVAAAGASRGTYYLYFRNKCEVAAELIAEYTVEAEALLTDLTQQSDPDRDKVKAWLEAYFALFSRHRSSIRAWMQAESIERSLRVVSDQRLERFLGRLTTWIGENRRRAGLPEPDEISHSRAVLLVAQLERLAYFMLVRKWEMDEGGVIESLADAWELSVLAHPAAR
ncbi:TetR/AcrR family transcriptional regulator [Amycolatopsis thermophila]|uniref:AcrR family transcriptional regulator n=1 Tax=Amycolatopsis thermophila TaxID=206084 RepID=A0ABU0F565_9PSEU|nr:TetR/AcrR family transcriptional regulator [Amycolatopsis thermophila]MDQ0382730.1 AcrR family transcriptional regulator [Amycolatopsis thermophila]